jgi:hypothetical protein
MVNPLFIHQSYITYSYYSLDLLLTNPYLCNVGFWLGQVSSLLPLESSRHFLDKELKMNQSTSKAHAYFGWTARAWSGVAIVGAVATAALIYAVTELSSLQENAGATLHESWLGHWMVIWVSALAALLALAAPMFAALSERMASNRNEANFFDMMKHQPSLRQEWMAMASRDLPELEKAIEKPAAESKGYFTESLEPLGGLTVEPAVMNMSQIRDRLSRNPLERKSFVPYL